MAYELFLLPVPPGGDVEEVGEALLARLDCAEEISVPASDAGAAPVIAALRATDPTLAPAPARAATMAGGPAVQVMEMRAAAGIEVAVARGFVRVRVPFEHRGDDAGTVFDRVFRLLGASSAATGWRVYDPQQADAADLDDEGRESALEVYLSVMDQLRPSGPGPATGTGRSLRAGG